MNRLIDRLSAYNQFPFYLAVFRVYLVFHLIKKLYLIWGSSSVLFSTGSFLMRDDALLRYIGINPVWLYEHYEGFLYVMLTTLVLVLFGVGRNWTMLVLFFQVKLFQETAFLLMNGGDNLLIFALMYLMVTDSFRYLSIHASGERPITSPLGNLLSNLGAYAIMIHLCLVYFVSALHKIHADVWFNGVATYYILHLERYQSPLNHYVYNNGLFVTVSTYFTVFFELLFPILIWNRSLRYGLLAAGLLMHMGIYFFMMIYDFQVMYIMVYGFFVSQAHWERLLARLQSRWPAKRWKHTFFKPS